MIVLNSFTISLLILLNRFYVHGHSRIQQKCLQKFLVQDYDFIPVRTSLKVSKCIYNHDRTEFDTNCPDKQLKMIEQHNVKTDQKLELIMESELKSDDIVVFERAFVFLDNPDNSDLARYRINIAEQLKINISGCAHFYTPFSHVIFLTLRNNLNLKDYGFLFFEQKILPARPDLIVMFGHLMVPLEAFNKSVTLNEEQYGKYAGKKVYDKSTVNVLLGCDLMELWNETCVEFENELDNNGTRDVAGFQLIWLYLFWSLLFFVALIY